MDRLGEVGARSWAVESLLGRFATEIGKEKLTNVCGQEGVAGYVRVMFGENNCPVENGSGAGVARQYQDLNGIEFRDAVNYQICTFCDVVQVPFHKDQLVQAPNAEIH